MVPRRRLNYVPQRDVVIKLGMGVFVEGMGHGIVGNGSRSKKLVRRERGRQMVLQVQVKKMVMDHHQ